MPHTVLYIAQEHRVQKAVECEGSLREAYRETLE